MARLNDLEVDDYLAKGVEIDPLSLQEEYIRLPADLGYWSMKYANAFRVYSYARLRRKRLEALLSIEHRERLADDGKRATEGMVSVAVETDPRFAEALAGEVEAEVEKVRLWGVLDAIRAKKDMLVSFGAQLRAEMDSDPTIRASRANAKLGKNDGLG